MKRIECPTCGEQADGVTRYIGAHSPAFLQPCGHFVEVHGIKPVDLRPHPTYGAGIREQDVDPYCWEMWRLSTSLRGRQVAGDPPVEWVRGHIRANA